MAAKKTLLIMRHAKSSWSTDAPDVRRPLSARGTRDAIAAGAFLAGFAPQMVWCSAATRTQQTWECAAVGGAACDDVRVRDDLYAASSYDVLRVLQSTPNKVTCALVIGHEPTVSDLALGLSIHSPFTSAIEMKFPTAAIAVLTHDLDWNDLHIGCAELLDFRRPHPTQ